MSSAVSQELRTRLGSTQHGHGEDVLQWLPGSLRIFCQLYAADTVVDPDFARIARGARATLRQEGPTGVQGDTLMRHPRLLAMFARCFEYHGQFASDKVCMHVARGSAFEWQVVSIGCVPVASCHEIIGQAQAAL